MKSEKMVKRREIAQKVLDLLVTEGVALEEQRAVLSNATSSVVKAKKQ